MEFTEVFVKLVAQAKSKAREKGVIRRQKTRFIDLTSANMIKGMPQVGLGLAV